MKETLQGFVDRNGVRDTYHSSFKSFSEEQLLEWGVSNSPVSVRYWFYDYCATKCIIKNISGKVFINYWKQVDQDFNLFSKDIVFRGIVEGIT
jgi:hypothetical protein